MLDRLFKMQILANKEVGDRRQSDSLLEANNLARSWIAASPMANFQTNKFSSPAYHVKPAFELNP